MHFFIVDLQLHSFSSRKVGYWPDIGYSRRGARRWTNTNIFILLIYLF